MENDSFWVLELENALVLTQLSDWADFGVAFDQAGPVHTDWVVTAGAVHCALAGKGLQLRERGAGYQVLVGLMLKRGHKITSKTFTVPTYPQSQAFPTTQFWSFAQWRGRYSMFMYAQCMCKWHQCLPNPGSQPQGYVLHDKCYICFLATLHPPWRNKRGLSDRPVIPLGRHWHHSCDKMYQAFPHCLHTLQVIKNWTMGKSGNEGNTHILLCPWSPRRMKDWFPCTNTFNRKYQRDRSVLPRAFQVTKGWLNSPLVPLTLSVSPTNNKCTSLPQTSTLIL